MLKIQKSFKCSYFYFIFTNCKKCSRIWKNVVLIGIYLQIQEMFMFCKICSPIQKCLGNFTQYLCSQNIVHNIFNLFLFFKTCSRFQFCSCFLKNILRFPITGRIFIKFNKCSEFWSKFLNYLKIWSAASSYEFVQLITHSFLLVQLALNFPWHAWCLGFDC